LIGYIFGFFSLIYQNIYKNKGQRLGLQHPSGFDPREACDLHLEAIMLYINLK
jgi:hypothetical protein